MVYLTNGDRIRSMSDEELFDWLEKQINDEREDWETLGCYGCVYYKTHHYPDDCGNCEWIDGLLSWLKREENK